MAAWVLCHVTQLMSGRVCIWTRVSLTPKVMIPQWKYELWPRRTDGEDPDFGFSLERKGWVLGSSVMGPGAVRKHGALKIYPNSLHYFTKPIVAWTSVAKINKNDNLKNAYYVRSVVLIPLQASLSFTISQSLLKLISIESVMPSNHLILCCPFLLLPSLFPSIRVFFNESVLHIRWPKYWSFSFSISLSMNIQDWFPLGLTSLIFLLSKGLSRVFSVWRSCHICTWLLEKS